MQQTDRYVQFEKSPTDTHGRKRSHITTHVQLLVQLQSRRVTRSRGWEQMHMTCVCFPTVSFKTVKQLGRLASALRSCSPYRPKLPVMTVRNCLLTAHSLFCVRRRNVPLGLTTCWQSVTLPSGSCLAAFSLVGQLL